MAKNALKPAEKQALQLFKENLGYFQAVGSSSRQQLIIFFWRNQDKGFTSEELAKHFRKTESVIIYQLQILVKDRFLFVERVGHQRFYYLDLHQVVDHLEQLLKAVKASYPNSTAAKVSRKIAEEHTEV